MRSFICLTVRISNCDWVLTQAEVWDFDVYIAGETPKSRLTYANLKKICDEYLPNNSKITVLDISKYPKLAKENEITAIPTIIRRSPLPKKTLIGDLSDMDRAISKLELK
jgi:circadian clock protein KaiB